MAIERKLWDESFVAENDLSAKQFYAVEISGALQVDLVDNAGDIAIGILQNKPKAGEEASVALLGISKAVVDGNAAAIAAGDALKTDANGKLIKTTTNNHWVIARALEATTTDGAIISVLLTGGYYYGA